MRFFSILFLPIVGRLYTVTTKRLATPFPIAGRFFLLGFHRRELRVLNGFFPGQLHRTSRDRAQNPCSS